jgi:uncharacterized protein (UPF0262 family)
VPPSLTEALIDDATWDAAGKERRHEWRIALDELIDDHHFGVEGQAPLRLLVTVVPTSHITFDLCTVDGKDFAHVDLPLRELEAHLGEYLAICREMGKLGVGENSPRLEALDIAKRLAHDEAAETIQRLCGALRPDHATGRRIFSLVVALHFDTTRLLLPHHRFVRR